MLESPARPALYLEDISVGMTFRAGPLPVTAEAIVAFAREFDPQPFHTDPDAAKNSFFQGLAASGWHTAAMTMRLLIAGGMPLAGGSLGLGAEVAWSRPVRPGDELSLESEVIEITPSRSKPNQAIVTIRTTTRNQNGETVQTLTSKVLAFNRGHIPGVVA